ncbi:twin-arginine translocation signal domain-containing protein [Halalkalicoccus sp. NIPERK01]|uniref:twin-arginine translocation signal domain-containing protein n=1 Tax=Halalkalicoccus sp. NIPERK01 TaxID=3053469 RepID=UPI00256EA7F3|nr:twin-arginine translocation signal domain-containing protein [Halalkalicoccus sp. NIPERK01]MDL5362282.1 twin-arginine translocation signal domain-containing protein [Halalkalicoccus sp. NIPERK01]
MNRRDFLRSAGATAVAVGVAGCSTSESGNVNVEDGRYPYPSIPERALDGWELTDRRAEHSRRRFAGTGLDQHTRTELYEFARLSEEVAEKTLGQFEGDLGVFFASRITFEGYASYLADAGRVADGGLGEMTAEMEAMGITDVTEVEPTDPRPTAADGQALREVVGAYPVEDLSLEAELPGDARRTFEVEGGEVPVRGFLTAWKTGRRTAYVAGGAYPDGDFVRESPVSVTGDGRGDGIDVTVSVALGLDPEAYREELVGLVERVE